MNSFINRAFIYAVIGATRNENKYGYKVFDDLKQKGFSVVPIHPTYPDIGGVMAFKEIASMVSLPDVAVLVVPPEIGIGIVKSAISIGVKRFWCQPGAESDEIRNVCAQGGAELVDDGSCIMVEAG